jgi:hypothetical protein
MPRVFRCMKEDGGGPLVARNSSALGVRIGVDISPDDSGEVVPSHVGMSVAPSMRDLPPFLIPARLKHLARGARGNNTSRVWRLGEGAFLPALVTLDLGLWPDSASHGVVEPARKMKLTEYEAALAATRGEWVVEES